MDTILYEGFQRTLSIRSLCNGQYPKTDISKHIHSRGSPSYTLATSTIFVEADTKWENEKKMARISIFKGREARLNKAIFWILAKQGSLTIYEIWIKLRSLRDFSYIRYHIVNRRVRALEEMGYIGKTGERITKTGFAAKLYQLTTRAYLAMLLDGINLDEFIEKAPHDSIVTAISAIIICSNLIA